MQEIWKDVIGYEGRYKVSNMGRISSSAKKECKILSPIPTYKGYLNIELWMNGKRKARGIHCIVAEAFIPNPLHLPQVNHEDGVKTNNAANNLNWCNQSQNQIHACRTGLVTHLKNKRTYKGIRKAA